MTVRVASNENQTQRMHMCFGETQSQRSDCDLRWLGISCAYLRIKDKKESWPSCITDILTSLHPPADVIIVLASLGELRTPTSRSDVVLSCICATVSQKTLKSFKLTTAELISS